MAYTITSESYGRRLPKITAEADSTDDLIDLGTNYAEGSACNVGGVEYALDKVQGWVIPSGGASALNNKLKPYKAAFETKNGITHISDGHGRHIISGTATEDTTFKLSITGGYIMEAGDYLHARNSDKTNEPNIQIGFNFSQPFLSWETTLRDINEVVPTDSFVGNTLSSVDIIISKDKVVSMYVEPMILMTDEDTPFIEWVSE